MFLMHFVGIRDRGPAGMCDPLWRGERSGAGPPWAFVSRRDRRNALGMGPGEPV